MEANNCSNSELNTYDIKCFLELKKLYPVTSQIVYLYVIQYVLRTILKITYLKT